MSFALLTVVGRLTRTTTLLYTFFWVWTRMLRTRDSYRIIYCRGVSCTAHGPDPAYRASMFLERPYALHKACAAISTSSGPSPARCMQHRMSAWVTYCRQHPGTRHQPGRWSGLSPEPLCRASLAGYHMQPVPCSPGAACSPGYSPHTE